MINTKDYTKHVGSLAYKGPQSHAFAVVDFRAQDVTVTVLTDQELVPFQMAPDVTFYSLPHILTRKEALDLAGVVLAHLGDRLAVEQAIHAYGLKQGILDRAGSP